MGNNHTEKERWKDIRLNEYTKTRYQVSNKGRIRNKKTGHILNLL